MKEQKPLSVGHGILRHRHGELSANGRKVVLVLLRLFVELPDPAELILYENKTDRTAFHISRDKGRRYIVLTKNPQRIDGVEVEPYSLGGHLYGDARDEESKIAERITEALRHSVMLKDGGSLDFRNSRQPSERAASLWVFTDGTITAEMKDRGPMKREQGKRKERDGV